MKKWLLLFLLTPLVVAAQTPARFDLPTLTTTPAQVPVGSLPALLAVTNATISVCGYPATLLNGMCTNTVATYTDSTLASPCPSTAQLTASGTSICTSTTGLQGAFGFWYDSSAQSHMTYTIKTAWGTFGPYDILQGGSGGGGCPGTTCVQVSSSSTQKVAQGTNSTLAVNNLNNNYLASQYQTPPNTGNNGIANVAALNTGTGLTGIADPGYAFTETIPNTAQGAYGNGTLFGANPNWPAFTDIFDDRVGIHHRFFTLSGNTPVSELSPWGEYYYNDYQVTGSTDSFLNALYSSTYNGIGQQINGFGGVNLKTYWAGVTANYYSAAQGQHLGTTNNMVVEGIGDVVASTNHVVCDGGASTSNDIGCQYSDNIMQGDHVIPTGTITSSPGTYALQVNLGGTVGHEGDNRYLIDKTTGVISGTGYPTQYFVNNAAFPPSQVTPWGQTGQIPPDAAFVGTSFTPSTMVMICTTAFGGACPNTSATNPSGPIQSVAGGYAPGTLTVQIITSAPGLPTGFQTSTSGFSAGDVVCIADSQYFESTTIASVIDSTHLSVNFRKPHNNGAVLSKGGTPGCQYGFENTGQTFQYGGTGQKYMQVWPVVGALTSTDLLVWDHNPQQNWSRALTGNNSAGYCGTDNIAVASVSSGGGTSTITFVDTATAAVNPNFIDTTVTISTANSTYNGAFAITPVSIFYNGKANYPAYQYTVSTVSGTQPTTGTATLCNQNYNFYPMVEVTDVRNPTTNQVDGYFQNAPYNISSFLTGDTVVEPHYFWQYVNESTAGDGVFQQLPQPAYVGVTTAGINYGDTVSGTKVGFDINNVSAQNLYGGYGGTLSSPQAAYQTDGPWQSILYSTKPPNAPGYLTGAVINIINCKPAPIGCNNAAYSPFAIYRGPGSNAESFYDNTYTNSIDFAGAIGVDGPGYNTMRLFEPLFGTLASSQDQTSSLTPDGSFEANGFQFWSTFTPPTGFDALKLYGDSSNSIGMIFPADGAPAAVNGGTLNVGGLQLYVPSTTTAVKTAGISATSTPGQISMDDGTPGDAQASVFLKNLTVSGTCTGCGGGGSLPTSNALGDTLYATAASSTTYTARTTSKIPVELYGATPYSSEAAAEAGPDDTAKFQSAVTGSIFGVATCTAGKWYHVEGPVNFASSEGLIGTSNQTYNALCGIVSNSATTHILSAVGSSGSFLSGVTLANLNIRRSVTPTTTAADIYASFVGGMIVTNTLTYDGIYDIYRHATPSFGIGYWSHNQQAWLLGETTGTYYGLYDDSADGNAENSVITSHNNTSCSGLSGAAIGYGQILIGTAVNDNRTFDLYTSGCNFGQVVDYTGAGPSAAAQDIHFSHSTHDTFKNEAILIENIPASERATVTVDDAWLSGSGSSDAAVRIINSSGVIIQDSQIKPTTGSAYYASASDSLSLANNQISETTTFTGNPAPVELNGVSHSSITGNSINATGGNQNNIVWLTGNSTFDTITGNPISGFSTAGVGIGIDAGSNNNSYFGNTIDTTHITSGTPIGDAGTNNNQIASNVQLAITNTAANAHVNLETIYAPNATYGSGCFAYNRLGVASSTNNDMGIFFGCIGAGSTSNYYGWEFFGNTTFNAQMFVNASTEFGETTPVAGPANGIAVGTTGQATIDGSGVVRTPSLLATGIVDGTTPITITSGSTATLGGTYHSGYTFNNDGATAVTYTLPTAAAGLQYCVANDTGATGTLKVATSATGQFIDNAGVNTATGGYVITAGALGDAGCFIGMDATHWKLYVQGGTWTTH